MKKSFIPIAMLSAVISAGAVCQDIIRFKEPYAGIKITEINVSNTRYGDGQRRGMTSLSITANRESGNILSVATDRCELKSLVDDKGLKMHEDAMQNVFGSAISWFVLGVSSDRKSACANAKVFSIPSIGATKLSVSGRIMLIIGRTKAISNATHVEIEEGTKVKAGDINLIIDSVEKTEDEKNTSIAFQYQDIPKRIIDIEFFNEKGAKIEIASSESSIIAIQPDGKGSAKIIYKLIGDISKADLRISYWQETDDVPAPFDLSIGLGLTK